MLGGVLSGLGMAASSFTQSINQLFVTAGVITGQQTFCRFVTGSGRPSAQQTVDTGKDNLVTAEVTKKLSQLDEKQHLFTNER